MKLAPLRPFMPVMITTIMSVLFKGQYDPAYVIALLSGLLLFFFGADCARLAAHALKTRGVHHYFIPLVVLRTYAPSLLILAAAWLGTAPFTPREFFGGTLAVAASFALIWATVWGVAAHVSKKMAHRPSFFHALNYGLNLLMFLTPIFYQMNAIRSPVLRTVLGYNPFAAAILTARTALVRGAQSALPPHAFASATTAALTLVLLGWLRHRRGAR